MSILKSSLPLIFLMALASNLQAQTESNPMKFDVIPPAPEAASLGKFIDMPVSAYSGIPKIDVPVYELKSYELKLPISLSYHASGIKWEEIPSWVGAGWTLNAGGLVSRTIRGRNDEDVNYGFFTSAPAANYDIPSFFNANGSIDITNFNYVNANCGPINNPPTPQYQNVLYASKGGLDLEPDLFFFSLPDGQSGKFAFSRAKQMKLVPDQYADVTYTVHPQNGSLFHTWKATGKDGTKYFFEKQEITNNHTPCKELFNGTPETFTIPDVVAPSTWKLTKIKSANGLDSIWFDYVAETLSYETTTSVTTYDRVIGNLGSPGSSICMNQTVVNGWRLSAIHTAAGYRVEFVANTSRADLIGGKMLDEIKIYFKTTFIKRHLLSYTGSLPVLTSVQEHFEATTLNTKTPSYEFTYYTEGIDQPVYNRTSYNLDHWGYYNGATNSKLSPPTIFQNVFYAGANREPSLAAARWMTLKEVKYPTGGTSTYDYELHDYSNIPAFTDFTYSPGLVPLESIEFTISNNPSATYQQTKQFTLAQNTPVVILYEIPAIPGGGIPPYGCHGSLSKSGDPQFPINFLSGNSQIASAPILTFTSGTHTLYGEFTPSLFNWGGLDLSTLKFYIKVYRLESMADRVANNSLKGGGLRVKKITNVGDQTLTKNFEYKNRATGISSGKLATFPIYTYLADFSDGQMQAVTVCVTNNTGTMLTRTNATSIPLAVSQGSHVGYDEVTEYYGDATINNGYTVYNFTNTPDVANFIFPFVPSQSFAYKNGLLLRQEDFNSANKPVRLTTNAYEYLPDPGITIMGMKIAQTLNSGCTGCHNRVFTYRTYNELTERVRLVQTISHVYDVLADSYLATNSHLTYDGFDQVVLKTETLSNETSKKKYTKYIYHPTMKTTPEEEYSYYSLNNTVDFEFQGGVKKVFNSYLKPSEIYLLETTPAIYPSNLPGSHGLFKRRLQFTQFDTQGNVLSFKKENDPSSTSVIWDSNKILPLAQAINATHSQIAFTSFENANNEGNWTFQLSQDPAAKTGIYSHKLNQSVTRTGLVSTVKYVVSYWAIGGTPTINGVIDNQDGTSAEPDGWWYYHKIVSGITSLTISGSSTIKIDELRLYPQTALMTTYNYDMKYGMTSSTDANNFTTYYSYTNRRQLEFVKDFEKNILKKNEYRYARDN